MTIRSYGPGKFSDVIDSYVYLVTLDGGADEEQSYPEGGRWYGLVRFDPETVKAVEREARENGDKLTPEELDQFKRAAGVILFERSDGIVEASWYSKKDKLEKAWKEIEKEFESMGEEDYG